MLYCVGGWVGIFSPLIAFIFKYIIKHNVLIQSMVLKIVNKNYIKSYDKVKIKIWKI